MGASVCLHLFSSAMQQHPMLLDERKRSVASQGLMHFTLSQAVDPYKLLHGVPARAVDEELQSLPVHPVLGGSAHCVIRTFPCAVERLVVLSVRWHMEEHVYAWHVGPYHSWLCALSFNKQLWVALIHVHADMAEPIGGGGLVAWGLEPTKTCFFFLHTIGL